MRLAPGNRLLYRIISHCHLFDETMKGLVHKEKQEEEASATLAPNSPVRCCAPPVKRSLYAAAGWDST